jgi:hypothetical protein
MGGSCFGGGPGVRRRHRRPVGALLVYRSTRATHTTRTESHAVGGGPTLYALCFRLKRTAATSPSRLDQAHPLYSRTSKWGSPPIYGALEGCGDQGGPGLDTDDTTTLCPPTTTHPLMLRSPTVDASDSSLSPSLSLSLCALSRPLFFLVAIPLFPRLFNHRFSCVFSPSYVLLFY